MQWILRLYGVLRMTLYLQVSSPSTYTGLRVEEVHFADHKSHRVDDLSGVG